MGARFAFGIGACFGLRDPLASMADYTAALMVLNQAVPPLLLLALAPRGEAAGRRRGALLRGWLDDPFVAAAVFAAVTIAISLPGILDPALADALFSLPLGLLELLAGTMVWRLLLRPPPGTAPRLPALLALLAGLPMTVVAVVWMLADHVLYAPYLDLLCIWDIPPLQDQRWAGFVMLVAGLPLQLCGVWHLVRLPAAERREERA